MGGFTAAEMLQLWERGLTHHDPVERGLLLLGAVRPALSHRELERTSIGRRDAALLKLHEQVFGPCIEATAPCPRCDNILEFGVLVGDLLGAEPDDPVSEHQALIEGYGIAFRLPNSADLAALSGGGDVAQASTVLARRCTLSVTWEGAPLAAEALPPIVVEQLEHLMVAADPLADIQLDLTCPACEQTSAVPLDIVSFLWTRINAEARRLLRDLDILARIYGWREADILALSPLRRQVYVELAQT